MHFDPSILTVALTGAVAYGAGDFLGGRAALRLSTFSAVAIAQTASAAYITHAFVQPGQSLPDISLVWPCTVAGCAYVAGVALLYRGFAHGQICIVAPLCSLFSILVPLAGDFHLQRQLDGGLLLGVALCTASAVVIASPSSGSSTKDPKRSVRLGVASGLGYGVADLIMGQTPASDASSALLVMRLVASSVALTSGAILILAGKRILRRGTGYFQTPTNASLAIVYPGGRAGAGSAVGNSHSALYTGLLLAATAGVLDVLGQISYMAAAAQGSMGVAAALVGLFPGVSVLLAVIILRERIGLTQLVGLAVGATGVLLVSY